MIQPATGTSLTLTLDNLYLDLYTLQASLNHFLVSRKDLTAAQTKEVSNTLRAVSHSIVSFSNIIDPDKDMCFLNPSKFYPSNTVRILDLNNDHLIYKFITNISNYLKASKLGSRRILNSSLLHLVNQLFVLGDSLFGS